MSEQPENKSEKETETVSSAAVFDPPVRSPWERTVVWTQRLLLLQLAAAHLVLPYFLSFDVENHLLLDAILPAQLALLLIALALGNLTLTGTLLLWAGVGIASNGWISVYPNYLREYAFTSLVLPLIVLAVVLLGLRLAGCRGSWNERARPPRPWQVSIRHLLLLTTIVAVALAVASWVRGLSIVGNVADSPFAYGFTVFIDGSSTAILSLLAIWAFGTPGACGPKFLVLLSIAMALAFCFTYAFQLEATWHVMALAALLWVAVAGGSLFVWRLCGWQVEFTRPRGVAALLGENSWLRTKLRRSN